MIAENSKTGTIADLLIDAGMRLMTASGPSALKARTVAAEAGMSTMVVYNYFGGVPELVNAVIDRGFETLETIFAELTPTDDAVSDLFRMALAAREYAHQSPHLYDAMFGLSSRATYRPAGDTSTRRAGRSEAFKRAYSYVVSACQRLQHSSRAQAEPAITAGALWSLVHGFITLELSEHFSGFGDPVREVLMPAAVTFCVGMGFDEDAALASHLEVLRTHDTLAG
ncbi:MAG: TetR/AcrR family transcriptional regulator [Rhodococcus sp. (in: high G+C Gram-positive bacteria)]|uniref:TetR/AcrR family transcriptional regulator n=1 Tax=Rhodococcus sp. TaxID=1831 RepID=UPI002AD873F8|nr:TetR/AcrR family transcriptional regulator [Rhodococcus sp. (in: high G+C Gram-positive bacteria)]